MATPFRTCVGCRRRGPQGELVRVVRTADGRLDVGRTLPGRGAWLCRGSLDCFEAAVRRGSFDHAFRVSVDAAALTALRAQLQAAS